MGLVRKRIDGATRISPRPGLRRSAVTSRSQFVNWGASHVGGIRLVRSAATTPALPVAADERKRIPAVVARFFRGPGCGES